LRTSDGGRSSHGLCFSEPRQWLDFFALCSRSARDKIETIANANARPRPALRGTRSLAQFDRQEITRLVLVGNGAVAVEELAVVVETEPKEVAALVYGTWLKTKVALFHSKDPLLAA